MSKTPRVCQAYRSPSQLAQWAVLSQSNWDSPAQAEFIRGFIRFISVLHLERVGVAYSLCLCDESSTSPVKCSYARGQPERCAGWCDLTWFELCSQHLLIYGQGALVAVWLYHTSGVKLHHIMPPQESLLSNVTQTHWRSPLCCVHYRQRDRKGDHGVGLLTRQNVTHTSHILGVCNPFGGVYWTVSLDLQEFIMIRPDGMIQRSMSLMLRFSFQNGFLLLCPGFCRIDTHTC